MRLVELNRIDMCDARREEGKRSEVAISIMEVNWDRSRIMRNGEINTRIMRNGKVDTRIMRNGEVRVATETLQKHGDQEI